MAAERPTWRGRRAAARMTSQSRCVVEYACSVRSAPMDIREATRSYESWLATHTTIVRADLALKHRRMTESPFVFLRATFYRWIARWPDVCADLRDAPRVVAVGDL